MKIQIAADGRRFTIPVPTNWIFSKGTVWFVNHVGRKYSDELQRIPPEALEQLFAEFRRIKRRCKHWTLVEVVSAGGEEVTIIL